MALPAGADDQQMSSDTSEGVRVHLQLFTKGGAPKEVVRKSTKAGYEVVEVDGFTFVRKRKAPAPQPEPSGSALKRQQQEEQQQRPQVEEGSSGQEGQQVEAAQGGQQQQDGDATQVSEMQDCADTAQAGAEELMDVPDWPLQPPPTLEEEAAQLLACVPPGCPASVKLQWVVGQALRLAAARAPAPAPAPAPTADCESVQPVNQTAVASASTAAAAATEGAVRGIASRFAALLAEEAARAQSLLRTGDVAAFEALPPMLHEQCAGDRLAAGLKQQLQELRREGQAWQHIGGKYRAQGAEPQQGAGRDAAAAAAAGAVQEAQQQAADEPSGSGGGGGDDAAMPDQPQAGSSQQEQQQQQQEVSAAAAEATGRAEAGAGGSGAAAASAGDDRGNAAGPTSEATPAAVAASATPAATAAAEPGQAPPSQRPLTDAQRRAALEMQMRVECMAAVVGKAEALVGAAEAVASVLQSQYHEEAFRTYPHVNSPAWLIKHLSQAASTTTAAAAAALGPSQA